MSPVDQECQGHHPHHSSGRGEQHTGKKRKFPSCSEVPQLEGCASAQTMRLEGKGLGRGSRIILPLERSGTLQERRDSVLLNSPEREKLDRVEKKLRRDPPNTKKEKWVANKKKGEESAKPRQPLSSGRKKPT